MLYLRKCNLAAGTSATPPASASRRRIARPPSTRCPSARPACSRTPTACPPRSSDVPDDYPLPITWPGILVSDPGHPEDIVARVRDALAVIWGDRSAAIEQEACEILGVSQPARLLRREEIRRQVLQRPPQALQQEPPPGPHLLAPLHRVRHLHPLDLLPPPDRQKPSSPASPTLSRLKSSRLIKTLPACNSFNNPAKPTRRLPTKSVS